MIRRAFLTVVVPIVFGYLVGATIGASVAGCGSTFAELEKAAKDGDVSAKLALCRGEARAAFYVEQKTEAESLARYEACKKREGL